MTSFNIETIPFERTSVSVWAGLDVRYTNWPVVYTLQSEDQIYVGETLNAANRLRQHLDTPDKQSLGTIRVILDNTFNKSACLDLESYLIRLFSGDGQFQVLNRNIGITDAAYFDRRQYQTNFDDVFHALKAEGLFSRTLPEIENSDLFKLSPFKALTGDQATAVEQILEGVFRDLSQDRHSMSVIQGNPGTGKTVIGIYLIKLLSDIALFDFAEPVDEDTVFSSFFTPAIVRQVQNLKIGLVVPQQSLRESIQRVFRKTPGLHPDQVLAPFKVGEHPTGWDLLIVDEAHRLNQRANQPSAQLNKKFKDINIKLFGDDDNAHTQLDWIIAQSRHQILLLDSEQAVRPADLPLTKTRAVIETAKQVDRWYPLVSQMRIQADEDYVGYVRQVLGNKRIAPIAFNNYEFLMFDDMNDLYAELAIKEKQFGLCRMLAGYAWPWASSSRSENPAPFDIDIDGLRFKWNTTAKDWVNSTSAFGEVGSIHTIQGYDLNYGGVIIGADLRYDPSTSSIFIDRQNYFDSKGKENNPKLGVTYSDEDLLTFITNIYAVLLTRGIRGTFVYVVDKELRKYLSQYIPKGRMSTKVIS